MFRPMLSWPNQWVVVPTSLLLLSVIPWVYLVFTILYAATRSQFLICRLDPFIGIFRLGGDIGMISFGIVLLVMSVFIGRPFCQFLCPYGALLSVFSALSWKKLEITEKGRDNIAPNSALYKDGRIFFCHGYNINGFQLQLADDLKSVKLTWRNETLDTHHGGYVLVNGKIYGSNWISNNDGNWCCVDWNTGKTDYEEKWTGGAGKGSIIAADNKLYIYDERRGFVGLVKPDPAKFDVVSKFRVAKGSGPYWAHMSIDKGVLYLRHGEYFAAYKIK